jgi:hypothetical protein
MATKRKSGSRLKGAGRKLDSLLFGIPENRAKFMRTGKNPAKLRAMYRAGYTAGVGAKRNPARDITEVLAAVERTKAFKEAAAGDLALVREFYLAGYHDGLGEKPSRENWPWSQRHYSAKTGEWSKKKPSSRTPKQLKRDVNASIREEKQAAAAERKAEQRARAARRKAEAREAARERAAVRKEAARDRARLRASRAEERKGELRAEKHLKRNPASVLVDGREIFTGSQQEAAALTARLKSEGLKATTKAAEKGARHGWRKNPGKRNPVETAEAAYEGFHGEKATHTFKLSERRHVHDVVWAFGPLVYLKVWLPSDRRKAGLRNFAEIEFDYEGKNPVLVTANEKRNQMFFDGGDQSVSLKTFGVPPEPHETVVLGEVSDAYYFTTKTHLGNQGGTAVYKHKLGEEGGELPTLIYHTLEKRLSLAGGSYTIPNEGVRN